MPWIHFLKMDIRWKSIHLVGLNHQKKCDLAEFSFQWLLAEIIEALKSIPPIEPLPVKTKHRIISLYTHLYEWNFQRKIPWKHFMILCDAKNRLHFLII